VEGDNQEGFKKGEKAKRDDEATDLDGDTYHLLDEITQPKKSSIPDLFVPFQDDEHADREKVLFALRHTKSEAQNRKTSIYTVSSFVSRGVMDDAVDVFVLKHRWRWKLVDENEDEEAMNASFLPENASRICRLVVRENATKISNTRKISRICRWKKKQMRWLKWTRRYAAVAGAERDWRQDVREAGLGADDLDLKRIRNKKDRWQHHMICFKQRKDNCSPLSWNVVWDN